MKVLFPKRAEYTKTLSKHTDCFFCDPNVLKKQECTHFSFAHWRVLVNKYPYMDGNVMVVPKAHKISLDELSQKEWVEFPQALLETQKALEEMFTTSSFNIGINLGKESGQSVSHLHWQVIPRKKKNHTVVGVLADIQVITLSPEELKKKLSKQNPSASIGGGDQGGP